MASETMPGWLTAQIDVPGKEEGNSGWRSGMGWLTSSYNSFEGVAFECE